MAENAVLFIFPLLMALAASSDLLTMKISNRLTLIIALCFLPIAVTSSLSMNDILMSLSAGLLVLTITFGMFTAGWIGGGDAKLAAATAVWLGLSQQLLDYVLIASILGGVLTLGLLATRRYPLPRAVARWTWAARLHDRDSGIPYGIALAAAALLVYPESRIWLLLVSGSAS